MKMPSRLAMLHTIDYLSVFRRACAPPQKTENIESPGGNTPASQ